MKLELATGIVELEAIGASVRLRLIQDGNTFAVWLDPIQAKAFGKALDDAALQIAKETKS